MNDAALEQNMKFYLQKLEQKHQEDKRKLQQLSFKINSSALKLQRCFRRYLLRKRTRAAIKIQRFWKKMSKKFEDEKAILRRVTEKVAAYKILYFLRSKLTKKQKVSTPHISKNTRTSHLLKNPKIHRRIMQRGNQFAILLSSLVTQICYIRKYMAYDKKKFASEWQIHEAKQREWMWQQIKKKWIRKEGNIWINDSQKEVNAEKYVNTLIEQNYGKYYEKYEISQQRLQTNQTELKNRVLGVERAFALSILIG